MQSGSVPGPMSIEESAGRYVGAGESRHAHHGAMTAWRARALAIPNPARCAMPHRLRPRRRQRVGARADGAAACATPVSRCFAALFISLLQNQRPSLSKGSIAMTKKHLTQKSPCEDWSQSYGNTWDDSSQGGVQRKGVAVRAGGIVGAPAEGRRRAECSRTDPPS